MRQQPYRLRVISPTGMWYQTRHLQAGDEFDVELTEYYNLFKALGWAADPPKEATSELAQMRVPELRELAEERGVELPSGYVKKEELVEMLEEAETDQGDEE